MLKLSLTLALGSLAMGCGSNTPAGSSSGSSGTGASSSTSGASSSSTGTSSTGTSGSTGSGSTASTGGSGGSGPIAVSQPGELVLPNARFAPNSRFLVYTVASGNPLAAAKVRVFDTSTQTSNDLGTPYVFCAVGSCTVLPEIIGMSKDGTMAAVQETVASPPSLDAVSIINLASGVRTPVTFTGYNEHLLTAFADGSYLSVRRTFGTTPGAIIYYPASGGSVTLTNTSGDPDSSSGIAIGELGGSPVVVAAVANGGASSVDVYPVDGSAPTHLGTGQKVWVVGDQVLFYDSSGPTLYTVSIAGGSPVSIGSSPVALDASGIASQGPQFSIAPPLVSADGTRVLLVGAHAVAISPTGANPVTTVVSSSSAPAWYDSQTLAFGITDGNDIPSVQFATLSATASSTLAADSRFIEAYNGRLVYGAETVFRVGTMNVTFPNQSNPVSFNAGDLFDAHVFSGAGDVKIWSESVTDLAGSPNGVALTRFDFDAQNGNAPAADDGLYYQPLD